MHAADLLEQRGLYAAELIAEQFNMSWIARRRARHRRQSAGHRHLRARDLHVCHPRPARIGAARAAPRRVGNGTFGAAAIDTAAEIAGRLQTYMLVRFGMSVLTGLGFWAFTAVYGLDLSREWGVIAFVLNFIPFIGSFIATLLPTLFAAAQYESFSAGGRDVHRAQCRPVRRRQLYRAARGRSGGFALPLHGAVRGVFLGDAVGHRRRLYRRADPDRAGEPVRQKSGDARQSRSRSRRTVR